MEENGKFKNAVTNLPVTGSIISAFLPVTVMIGCTRINSRLHWGYDSALALGCTGKDMIRR